MNPLTDLLPPKVRLWLYAVVTALSAVFAVWQVSQGDWAQFLGGVAAALTAALAGSNTNITKGE